MIASLSNNHKSCSLSLLYVHSYICLTLGIIKMNVLYNDITVLSLSGGWFTLRAIKLSLCVTFKNPRRKTEWLKKRFKWIFNVVFLASINIQENRISHKMHHNFRTRRRKGRISPPPTCLQFSPCCMVYC